MLKKIVVLLLAIALSSCALSNTTTFSTDDNTTTTTSYFVFNVYNQENMDYPNSYLDVDTTVYRKEGDTWVLQSNVSGNFTDPVHFWMKLSTDFTWSVSLFVALKDEDGNTLNTYDLNTGDEFYQYTYLSSPEDHRIYNIDMYDDHYDEYYGD